MFCKNFYIFFAYFIAYSFVLSLGICFAFCLASRLWAKYRKCGFVVKKQVDFRTKMPVMRKKPFLAFVQIMGKKVYENMYFGRRNGQNGRRERIYVQIEPNHKKLIFNTLHKRRVFFAPKPLHCLAFCKTF